MTSSRRWWPPRVLLLLALTASRGASAWIYPEHRQIAVAGVQQLSSEDLESLTQLWALGRPAFHGPLCEALSPGEASEPPGCIDFSALTALSGDHACSPRDVVEQVLPSSWVLGVAEVAAKTRVALSTATSSEQRSNRVATSNLELQAVDPDYASRAGANNAHFVLGREGNDLAGYLQLALARGAPLNAIGLYLQYHGAALALAHALALEQVPAEKASLARDALALEGYALHWLEDAFAAGHVVGTWGSSAWRKGTHDYYNVHGFDTQTWAGERVVLYGDANLHPEDLARASAAVAGSLAELASALRDPAVPHGGYGPGPVEMFAFDSCHALTHPAGATPEGAAWAARRLEGLPLAARGATDVHLPRFREELGLFIGAYASGAGTLNLAKEPYSQVRPTFSLGAGLRLGFAAPGITGTFGTAKAFLDVGLALQSSQLQGCYSVCDSAELATLLPRVPARSGLRFGLRLPFFLIPGDLLLLTPLLLPFSPSAFNKVGIAALSGGFIPYERSVQTPAGVIQVIAGREVDAVLFGYTSDVLEVLRVGTAPNGSDDFAVASVRSVRLSFPLVEWTPFRSFATNVTFGVPIHLGFGVEVPISTRVVLPATGVTASAPITWTFFLGLQTNVQYFVDEREDTR